MHSRLYKRIEASTTFYISSLCSCSETTMAVINCQIVLCFVLLLSTPGLGTTEISEKKCQEHIPIDMHCHEPYCTDEVCKPKYGPHAYGVCYALQNACTCSYPCET